MPERDLKSRTATFARAIVALCLRIPWTPITKRLGEQLIASGTSVGANYGSATRARSKTEFIAKLGIVVEEAEETLFWLRTIRDTGLAAGNDLNDVTKESEELLAIFCAAQRTAKRKR